MIIAEPLEIRNIRRILTSVSKTNGLAALMYRDMLSAITMVSKIPEETVSNKPLEIFIHANYDPEALDMVRDCIIFEWLHRLENSSLYNLADPNTAPRNILRPELSLLGKYARLQPVQIDRDNAVRAGMNQIGCYDRTTLCLRGDFIWRHGVRQQVRLEDVKAGRPTWRNRFCLATFATDIEYGQFIHNDHVQRWR